MVPPIKLWDAGVPNEAALKIMTRNSRMPDSLAADLDAECSACLMGAAPARRAVRALRPRRRSRPRSTPSSTRPPRPTAARSCRKIPDGTYVWEDYAEHDGVDEPRLHTQRITLTKTRPAARPGDGGPKLVIDFTGTAPQAKGPINHCGDYADGNFLKKWLAPILRNLADTPERMAELDVNEGIVPLIEMKFPEKGTLLTPIFPAPTNARTFVILRLLGVLAGVARQGRRRPDAGRPGDDPLHRRLRQRPRRQRLPHARGARRRLRRPLLRRRRGHHPRRARLAQPADGVHREPVPVPRRAARPGRRLRRRRAATAAAWATRSTSGCSRTPTSCPSPTARSSPAGASRAARPGGPFQVTIDLGGPNEREVDALADAEPVKAGEVIRIRTTGGGGWGDPLDRPYDEVERDLRWGKVSFEGARTRLRRGRLRRQGRPGHRRRRPPTGCAPSCAAARPAEEPFFDRGPGYARLAEGRVTAEVDWL